MEDVKQKIKVKQHTCMGTPGCVGWLFTIGFLHLSFWKGLLALLLWPYDLGSNFSSLAH